MKIKRHCPLSRSGACQCFPAAEEDEVPEGGDGRQGRGKSCKRTFNVKGEKGAKLIEQTLWQLTILLQVHWSESETRSVTVNGETRNETVYIINLILVSVPVYIKKFKTSASRPYKTKISTTQGMIKDSLLVLMVFIFHFFLLILSSPEKKPFQALLCAKLQFCDLLNTTVRLQETIVQASPTLTKRLSSSMGKVLTQVLFKLDARWCFIIPRCKVRFCPEGGCVIGS